MAFLRETSIIRSKPALWAAAGMVIVAILVITAVGYHQPQPVELTDPQAKEISAVIIEAERLFDEVGCRPAVSVDVLDGVLADWSGYPLSGSAWNMVARVYGQKAAANAGFLTYRKAYYLSMRGDYPGANAAPAGGLRPTARPVIYCATPAPEKELSVKSIAVGPNRAVAHFETISALKEAVLIFVEGEWKIASIKQIQLYF